MFNQIFQNPQTMPCFFLVIKFKWKSKKEEITINFINFNSKEWKATFEFFLYGLNDFRWKKLTVTCFLCSEIFYRYFVRNRILWTICKFSSLNFYTPTFACEDNKSGRKSEDERKHKTDFFKRIYDGKFLKENKIFFYKLILGFGQN